MTQLGLFDAPPFQAPVFVVGQNVTTNIVCILRTKDGKDGRYVSGQRLEVAEALDGDQYIVTWTYQASAGVMTIRLSAHGSELKPYVEKRSA